MSFSYPIVVYASANPPALRLRIPFRLYFGFHFTRAQRAALRHAGQRLRTFCMTIRPMEPSDLPAARELWSRTEGVEIAEGDSVEELTRYLARNPGCSHIAIDGRELIGAVLAGHDGRRGFLYHLAVTPKARGCGLGRKLVESATNALRAQGISRSLILVDRENAAGFAFWRRCQWEDMPFAAPMGLDL